MTKLKGKRLPQLRLLEASGAVSRETAVPVSFGGGYAHVTLALMIGEGLVEQGQLPFKGDTKRRVSHYWLSVKGLAVLQEQAR